nr:lysophospholipase [Gemmatimonadota bacterium]
GFLRMGTFGQRQYYGLFGLIPAFGPVKRASYPFRGAASTGNFDYVLTFDALLREIDLLSAAAAIEAPMLLVYGERDRLASAGSGEALAKRLRRGEILRVPDGTHYSTSFHPLTVARVTSWITAHLHPS